MSSGEPTPILQAAAVPYRLRNGRPEFCLITSIRKGSWGIPKGIIDPGETGPETALKEAEEEAGLVGRIEGDPLGRFEYFKWGTVLDVTVYLMRVTHTADDWPEASMRERTWSTAEEARQSVGRDQLRPMIDAAVERIGGL
jgi:8-oxo-dGTP pyrophosphatase MutT (NUDIX family)